MIIEHGKFLLELSIENVSPYSVTRAMLKSLKSDRL